MLKENYTNLDISVIIPSFYYLKSFNKVIKKVLEQTIKPLEIIIIDSSADATIKDSLNQYNHLDNIVYKKVKRSYPGKARNIGSRIAKGKILAFIDSKTIPEVNWLEQSLNTLNEKNLDVIFGKTKYISITKSQELFKIAIYGNSGHETVPGSLIKTDIFQDSNEFIDDVRTAEDIAWRFSLKDQEVNYACPVRPNVFYFDIPNSFITLLFRYFIYSFNTIKINAQNNSKDLYLSILAVLVTLIIPKWNNLFNFLNFEYLKINQNILTILFSIFIIYLINILFKYTILRLIYHNPFHYFMKLSIFFFSSILIFNWNLEIFDFIWKEVWNIPNITKIYLSSIVISGLLYRGLILPLNRSVSISSLFPLRWILIGLIGICFDILKAPSYILGGFYSIKNYFINTINVKYNNNKKLLIICPYPKGEQAGQRLKYEQQFQNFEKLGFEIIVKPFMDKEMWNIIYKKGFFFKKIRGTIKGYLKRFFLIFQLYKYDTVYVFLWATPFEDYIFERLYFFFSKKIIYDIEDNVLLMEKNEINPITYYLKSKNKITYLIKNSNKIITSSKKLTDICNEISSKDNSFYIPPGIDLMRYNDSIKYQLSNMVTIGWTGTFTSKKYLNDVMPILIKLSNLRKIKLLIIANFDYANPALDIEVIQWTKKKEIEDLLKMDIGIYPLLDEKWVEGKSGLKALQYMALGIPTIASNIGNTQEVIKHMNDGILVNNPEEWLEAFILLIDDINLRKKLGQNSKQKIIDNYSVELISKEYKKILLLN